MSDTYQIGKKLVGFCKAGKEGEGLKTLYAPHAISYEPIAGPNQVCEGVDAIIAKHKWWNENTIVHDSSATGPFPYGDRFAVIFDMDVTMKHDSQRVQMQEVGLYTVEGGKIIKEEFMYHPA